MTAPSTTGGAPRGSVIVAPGRTEFIEKYFEVIRELQQRGFAVFCIDWRGQGLSGREVQNGQKGHLASFDDPVNDLSTALKLLADRLPKPHIVVAHSMGGAIALRALQIRRLDADAAAFSAPMWGVAGLNSTAKRYVRFMTALGASGQFAPRVQKRWVREAFKQNPVTNDPGRYERCQCLVAEEPRLALAGPTVGWVAAAADVIEGFTQAQALAHVRIPILVASAADEMLVDNASHAAVVAQLPNARHIVIANAKHEILMERDEVRAQFWAAFDDLVAQVAPALVA